MQGRVRSTNTRTAEPHEQPRGRVRDVRRFVSSWSVAAALVLALSPAASAEFGPESSDGFPVDVLGRVQYPPVAPASYACETPACVATAEGYASTAAAPLNKVGPLTVYPYYPLLTAEVQRLASDHPDLVKLTSGGKSTAGLDLWLLEIADFARIDAGEGVALEARERLWIDGGTHSNEYSGVYFTLEVAQFLLDEYGSNETATWIVENRHTVLMPLVNPDGSHLFGRLNAKAVNVNRNYPVGWAGLKEDPVFNNPGPSAASEVETQAVMALWDQVRPDYVASIHCCGNLWLYPYGIEGIVALDNATFARACTEAFPDVGDDCGPIWSTIYPASGSSVDTAYEQVGAFAWGMEMSGRGNLAIWGQPVTDQDVRVQEKESWDGVMHAFLNVEKYGGHPRIVGVEGDATTMRITVENDGWGPLTNASLSAFLGGPAALSSYRAELPTLAAGERATVAVPGGFKAGDLDVEVHYVKRLMASPTGTLQAVVPLVAEGDRLVGVLQGASLDASAAIGAPVPGLGAFALVLTLVGAAVASRRR